MHPPSFVGFPPDYMGSPKFDRKNDVSYEIALMSAPVRIVAFLFGLILEQIPRITHRNRVDLQLKSR